MRFRIGRHYCCQLTALAAYEWTVMMVDPGSAYASELFGVTDFFGMRADGFYCGDDIAAKALVRDLIAEIGMDPVDVGPLRNARLLEPMALLWIDLANNRGWGRNHAFKLLRRG